MALTVALHHTEHGQGSPLILLHGFPLNNTIWAEQARALSDHYRVITPDLRGHGNSPAIDGVYDMDALAEDVFRLMDTLGIDQAPILGHSMGGYVVLAGWRLAPERFTALGLVASHALADSDEARQGRYQLVEQTIEQGPSAVAETMLPKLFAPQADPEEQHTQVEQVRAMILRTPVLGILGALKGMAARADLTATLPHINVPALVLVGDSDQLIPFARSEAAFKGLPNASLVTIERAGHMPMLEQPQATALAIRNFLAEQHPFKGT